MMLTSVLPKKGLPGWFLRFLSKLVRAVALPSLGDLDVTQSSGRVDIQFSTDLIRGQRIIRKLVGHCGLLERRCHGHPTRLAAKC